MTTPGRRDDAQLRQGLTTWCAARRGFTDPEIAFTRPSAGWSNETLLVTARDRARDRARDAREERFVVRLPPLLPAFPSYELGAQARVLDALASEPVPVPRVVAFEDDPSWLGAPFLATSFEAGRPGPEAPALDPWLLEAPPDRQRALHEAFLAMLATLHTVAWHAHDLAPPVRGGDGALAAEIEHWTRYVAWATDGAPPTLLADALAWCARTRPAAEPPASLCWGDARIGNVLFSEAFEIRCVLDWELASAGPAEMDLAWYLVLDDLLEQFTHRTVPGFLPREQAIAHYERALGRAVADLPWHEVFALSRSVAISERLARLATIGGFAYPGIAGDDNPILHVLARRIEALDR